METREVVIPHDPKRGPLIAVRRMLIHSSIAELIRLGLYTSYCDQISSDSLERINELLGPGWMPLELALAHYGACDKLGLEAKEIELLGSRAGAKIGDLLLPKTPQGGSQVEQQDLWKITGAFSRMQHRIYDGGSSQYSKLGPKKLLIEYKNNPLFAIDYYRSAYTGFMRSAFGSLGIDIADIQLSAHRVQGAQTDARFTWK
jgi:hypothetical protein